jgi:hypothetical protein
MACHELAALRLALMEVLGIDDEAEKQHELAELGAAAHEAGPIRSLREAKDLASVQRFFEAALAGLEERVSKTAAADPKLPYYQTLIVLTKKVEQDLRVHVQAMKSLCQDLEEVHDYLHEIYPGK